jgi:6-phosphogluconolactonase
VAAVSQYELITSADRDSLAKRAAETVAQVIDLTLAERDRVQIALSGGSTPEATYHLLGREHLAWDRVDLLMGDERYVPADDPLSNARMVRNSLMAEGPGKHACFHPVPTDGGDVNADVARFNGSLEQICGSSPPQFDLILLGLGDDGHTASLFPGTAATQVKDHWVTVGEGKGIPRITLTPPVLCAARQVVFLVAGAAKQQALARLLDPAEDPARTPAKLVQTQAKIAVLADAAASDGLA